MSKIERVGRTAKREHVHQLMKILKLNEGEATALWLADQVFVVVADEEVALKALAIAQKELNK